MSEIGKTDCSQELWATLVSSFRQRLFEARSVLWCRFKGR